MQHAVFATGGKQYLVKAGDRARVEKISGEHKEGDKLVFYQVLLIDDGQGEVKLGTPFVEGASVITTLNKIGQHKKIEVIKYKPKSRYFKRYGHRQPYFEVKIDSIKHS